MTKVFFAVPPEVSTNLIGAGKKPEDIGIINQHGLNRKVSGVFVSLMDLGPNVCSIGWRSIYSTL